MPELKQDARLRDSIRIETCADFACIQLAPPGDPTNRLSRRLVQQLTAALQELAEHSPNLPLIITGNDTFFSAGADLNEINALNAVSAYDFAKSGQRLMNLVANHRGGITAAIQGYCMGGGLDLALACHRRIAAPDAVFAHRGAALGIITGWGGTQRLPRLIGQARALQMFLVAEKLSATEALQIGLVDEISANALVAAQLIAARAAAPVS